MEIVTYFKKNSYGKWMPAKTQEQDEIYGVEGKNPTSFRLGMIRPEDGKLIFGNSLLIRMQKSKWNGKTFAELIPDMPARVPQYLPTPDGNYPWNNFDPDNSATWPTSNPTPERGWECETDGGWYCQNLPFTTVSAWGAMGIFRYRQQKMSESEIPMEPNPDYPIVEEQRSDAHAEFINLVRDNLLPIAFYQFQGLPLNVGSVEYKWRIVTKDDDGIVIDTVEMMPDPAHRLAVAMVNEKTSTWKKLPAFMRTPEVIDSGSGPYDAREFTYNLKTKIFLLDDLSKDAIVAYLCQ